MEPLPEHIADLIRQGRKIEAIKLLREETGASLLDAKNAVEQLSRSDAFVAESDAALGAEDANAEVRRLAYEGKKIEAIKALRAQTGLGLKDAKEAVERLPMDPAAAARGTRGLVLALAILALLIGLAVFFLGGTG